MGDPHGRRHGEEPDGGPSARPLCRPMRRRRTRCRGPESGTSTPSTCRAGCGARLGESRHGRRRGTDKGQERQREGEAGSPCDHWRALHCRGEQASVQPRPSARCHAAAVTRSSRSAAGKQCACGRRRLPGATVPRRRRAALVQRVPDGPGAVGSGPGSGRAERLGPCCVGSLSCRASVKIRPYRVGPGTWTGILTKPCPGPARCLR